MIGGGDTRRWRWSDGGGGVCAKTLDAVFELVSIAPDIAELWLALVQYLQAQSWYGPIYRVRGSVRDVDTCEVRLNFGCGELLKLHSREMMVVHELNKRP